MLHRFTALDGRLLIFMAKFAFWFYQSPPQSKWPGKMFQYCANIIEELSPHFCSWNAINIKMHHSVVMASLNIEIHINRSCTHSRGGWAPAMWHKHSGLCANGPVNPREYWLRAAQQNLIRSSDLLSRQEGMQLKQCAWPGWGASAPCACAPSAVVGGCA